MVLRVKQFQFYFPKYLAELTLAEYGRPPYPNWLEELFSSKFLRLLIEPTSVSVESAENPSVGVSVPETEESTVVIHWNDDQPPELIRSSSESAEVPIVSPPSSALRTISSPAPTKNEHRLAPTNRLNEPNLASRVRVEPSPIARYRIAPFRPLERLEDAPSIVDTAPQTSLVMDRRSTMLSDILSLI